MSRTTKLFAYFTIATFLAFFVIEAVLWTWPLVYGILLPQLNPANALPLPEQAEVLRALFINQGLYNLLAAAGGGTGLFLVSRGRVEAGRLFVTYNFVFAIGAAVTLLASTHAYVLGVAQAAFPVLGLVLLRRETPPESR